MHQVTVRYFAALREQAGIAEEVLEIPRSPLPVADVIGLLGERHGGEFASALTADNVRVAINQEFAVRSQVSDGDEVAFLPPVTGG